MQHLTKEQAGNFRIYTSKKFANFEMLYFTHDNTFKFVIYHITTDYERHLLQIRELIESREKFAECRKLFSLKLEENYPENFLNLRLVEKLKGEDYVDVWGLDQVKCYNYWLLRTYCPECDYHFVISSVKL